MLRVRVQQEELALLRARARAAGERVGPYVRRMLGIDSTAWPASFAPGARSEVAPPALVNARGEIVQA